MQRMKNSSRVLCAAWALVAVSCVWGARQPSTSGGSDGTGGTTTGAGGSGQACSTPSGLVAYTAWPFNPTEAQRRQAETAAALGLTPEVDIDLGGGVTLPMVVVPQGVATLGSDPSVRDYESDETLHTVTFCKPYLIGKTTLTLAQYKAIMGALPVQDPGALAMDFTSMQQPALEAYRTVQDVLRAKLQSDHAPAGWTFRLPSENEWEYAARSGAATVFSDGDTEADLAQIAWYEANSGGHMHDVATKLPNAWNIFDMEGNDWHWVWYPTGAYYTDSDNVDGHLVHGCGATSSAFDNGCRTSNRNISMVPVAYRFVADVPIPTSP